MQTTNDKRQTTNDKRQTTNDKRQTTNDKRQTKGSVYFKIFGCHNLRHDVRKILSFIKKNGFVKTDDPSVADYFIFAGCGVVESSETVSLQMIFDLYDKYKKNGNVDMIVYGCISTIAEKKLKKYGDLIIVKYGEEWKFSEIFFTTQKIDTIVSTVACDDESYNEIYSIKRSCSPQRYEFIKANKIDNLDDTLKQFGLSLSFEKQIQKNFCAYLDKLFKTDLFTECFLYCTEEDAYMGNRKDIFEVKTGTGCLGTCSYCIVKKVKGQLKSVSAEKILPQIEDGIKQGYKKFMFIADECGHWGKDIGDDFCNLLDNIASICSKHKHHIGLMIPYLHPDKLIQSYERLLPHFQSGLIISAGIPVQTGSKKIMKLMNRHTDIDKLKFVMQDMYKKKVSTYFYAQAIIGFPKETMKDFYDTIEFYRDTHFDFVNFMTFSARKGTPAAKFRGQISFKEMTIRDSAMRHYLNNFRSFQLLRRITIIYDNLSQGRDGKK